MKRKKMLELIITSTALFEPILSSTYIGTMFLKKKLKWALIGAWAVIGMNTV